MRRKASIATVAIVLIGRWPGDAQVTERFEVASVRISPPGGTGITSWNDSEASTFTATNIPLRILIQMAGGMLTQERLKPMLRSMLAERFGLIVHRETTTVSGYALVTAVGGAKLHASDASRAGQSAILRGRIIGRAADMHLLASMLGRPLGVPVLDGTGIKGAYDIDLKFAPDDSIDSSLPSIFTAIREQLGLRLESRKVPLEMLVIDRCRRVPTEN